MGLILQQQQQQQQQRQQQQQQWSVDTESANMHGPQYLLSPLQPALVWTISCTSHANDR
jgi:hypothetical protein